MKHIKVYENFEDNVPEDLRDLFALNDEFIINFTEPSWGGDREAEYCRIKGPSENFDAAEEIVDEFKEDIQNTQDSKRFDGEYIDEMDIDEILHDGNYYEKLSAINYHIYYDGRKYIPDPSLKD
jgi:hypothetical protein